MAKRDYYEILGVTRECTEVDLKKSYRKLALELHPDRNPGNQEAEERFKEVSEAFGVLSDSEKRTLYDQFGHEGLSGQRVSYQSAQDIFSQFGDMFSEFFGGGRRQRGQGPVDGADLRARAVLTLKEAAFGAKKEVSLRHPAPCTSCDATGAEGGKRVVCARCQGAGQISQARGPFLLQTTCPACQGAGSTAETPCKECHGRGEIEVERKVKVTFPEGIDSGQTLRVSGQGVTGVRGGRPGHLYVEVQVEQDENFVREGYHLITSVELSFPEAALGTTRKVQTLEGDEIEVEFHAGLQPGEHVVLERRGVPHFNRGGRGDLVVAVQVRVPKKLSSKAKKLLKELEATLKKDGDA